MMRIKTFTSDSVPEALLQIRKELGPGAVILKTNRTVRKRFLGLLPSMAYEITAAADPTGEAQGGREPQEEGGDLAPRAKPEPVLPKFGPGPEKPLETYEVADTPPLPKPRRAAEPKPAAEGARVSARESGPEDRWAGQFDRLADEIQNLGRLVSRQPGAETIAGLLLRDKLVGEQLQELVCGSDGLTLEVRRLAYAAFQDLLRGGVGEDSALLLIREVLRNWPGGEDVADRMRLRLNRAISRMTRVAPIDPRGGRRAHIFLGPTGVGKTTTIAKLAARLALKDQRRVRLLTFDTYRIAAAEQLRSYGDIIGIPVRVVFTAEELMEALKEAPPDEFVLIDTTGHSHKKVSEYAELSGFLRNQSEIEKHLVLSCTTREENLRENLAGFGVFRPDRLIFTKLDETSTFGVIFNEAMRANLPISYLTNGQDVAEDLIIPTAATLADLLAPLN